MLLSLHEFLPENTMLNRRILRIKAFKVIYGYAVTGSKSLEDAYSELDASCESTRDLYLLMDHLGMLPAPAGLRAFLIFDIDKTFRPDSSALMNLIRVFGSFAQGIVTINSAYSPTRLSASILP